jgi:ABC-type branched-subunit amino acid transport system ATPase component
MAHFRRARWGLRRTFQTEQAIEDLSIYDNVAMVHEHSKLSRTSRREEVLGTIAFVGIRSGPHERVGTLGAGERRLSSSPARWWASREWSCSTNRRRGSRTRRPLSCAR